MKTTAVFAIALLAVLACTSVRAQECDKYAMTIMDTAVPPLSPFALKSAEQKAKDIPSEPDVVLLGDSLMDNWGKSVEESFPEKKIWNFGVGRDLIQNVAWRFDQVDRSKIKPKNVIVLVGTNNLSASFTPGCAISSGISNLVAEVSADWPDSRVFLVGLLPRGIDFQFRQDDRQNINAKLKEFASARDNVAYVQVDEAEITCGKNAGAILNQELAACTPGMAYACTNYDADNLHINANGYKVLRKALSAASVEKFKTDTFK